MTKRIDKVRPQNINDDYDKILLKEIKKYFFLKKNNKKLNSKLLEIVRCPSLRLDLSSLESIL